MGRSCSGALNAMEAILRPRDMPSSALMSDFCAPTLGCSALASGMHTPTSRADAHQVEQQIEALIDARCIDSMGLHVGGALQSR